MKTEDAIKQFKSVANIADICKISVQAVYKWGESVPKLREYQLREAIANGWSAEMKIEVIREAA